VRSLVLPYRPGDLGELAVQRREGKRKPRSDEREGLARVPTPGRLEELDTRGGVRGREAGRQVDRAVEGREAESKIGCAGVVIPKGEQGAEAGRQEGRKAGRQGRGRQGGREGEQEAGRGR